MHRPKRLKILSQALRAFSDSPAGAAGQGNTSAELVRQILRFPTKELSLTEQAEPPAPISKKKPQSIFDLNKSRLGDIYAYFLEGNDIAAVNQRFGTKIKEFRHGLPIPNIDPGFKNLDELKEELNPTPLTPIENLYTVLSLSGESSYEDYESALQAKFDFSNLLGEAVDNPEGALALYDHQKMLAIPRSKLENERHMKQIRKTYELNFNIPGSVELIDPNRFLENLRPVEEFRHTPIIPISQAEMDRFEEKKRKRREEPFHIVYTKEKAFTVFIFMTTGIIIYILFKFAMGVEEEMFIDYKRTKLKRLEESLRKRKVDN